MYLMNLNMLENCGNENIIILYIQTDFASN